MEPGLEPGAEGKSQASVSVWISFNVGSRQVVPVHMWSVGEDPGVQGGPCRGPWSSDLV